MDWPRQATVQLSGSSSWMSRPCGCADRVHTIDGSTPRTRGVGDFANRTTDDDLGSNTVYGVYAVGSTSYAATNGGLCISTDDGDNFANRTTDDGLGSNSVLGVYVDGGTIYAATTGGLSITADCVSTSTSSSDANVPGIFLAVNDALVGGQVEGSPVYYGTNRVAVTSTYVLTVTAVSNVSPSVVTLAEGTIGADGSFSSMVRLPNLAPGTYNVCMTGEHTNGAALELTSQVTIDAGVFTSIGANIPVIR
jgi:hypothetical protein